MDGFYLTKLDSKLPNICEPCIDKCLECKSQDDCSTCLKGYFFNDDKVRCEQCNLRCSACTSSVRCTECAKGYIKTVRTCITERVWVLYMLGLGLLGIATLILAGCILICCFTSYESQNPSSISNLFESEDD